MHCHCSDKSAAAHFQMINQTLVSAFTGRISMRDLIGCPVVTLTTWSTFRFNSHSHSLWGRATMRVLDILQTLKFKRKIQKQKRKQAHVIVLLWILYLVSSIIKVKLGQGFSNGGAKMSGGRERQGKTRRSISTGYLSAALRLRHASRAVRFHFHFSLCVKGIFWCNFNPWSNTPWNCVRLPLERSS